MKLCAPDCVVLCTNCSNWKPADRWGFATGNPSQEAFCELLKKFTDTDEKCDNFHCMHTDEE